MANAALTSLTSQLKIVNIALTDTLSKLEEASVKSGEVTDQVTTDSESISKNTSEASSRVGQDLEGMQSKTTEAVETIENKLSGAQTVTQQATQELESLFSRLQGSSDSALNDLLSTLDDIRQQGAFDITNLIELIKLGVVQVSDLSFRLLNAEINGKKLRDILQGLDIEKFRQDIFNLVAEMRTSGPDIERILQLLIERGGALGKVFVDLARDARAGNISIENFRRQVKLLLEQLGEEGDVSALQGLLDALADAIDQDRATD